MFARVRKSEFPDQTMYLYSLILPEGSTVAEVIEYILQFEEEYGLIGIDDGGKTAFGSINCSYSHGVCCHEMPEEILNSIVLSGEVSAGNQCCNYILKIE